MMFKGIKLRKAVQDLQSKKATVRRAAAEILGQIGDIRAVEPLMEALGDFPAFGGLVVREAVIQALVQIGADAVEPLVKVLQDKAQNYILRACVPETLGRIGDARAVEPLVRALQSKSEIPQGQIERREVAKALGQIGDARAVEPLTRALQDESSDVRRAAAKALGQMADIRAVEPLVAALKDLVVHDEAKQALVQIGADAVEPLVKVLQDKAQNYILRAGVAETLGRIGDVPYDERVRAGVAETLGRIGDARAVEPLVRALQSKSEMERREVVKALGQIGDARAVEPLTRALQDESSDVRREAAKTLGQMADIRAVEPLMEALKGGFSAAAAALAAIDLSALLRELNDGNSQTRELILPVLGKMEGSAAAVALPHVIAFLSDSEEKVRVCAVNALGEMGPSAKEAVPFLIDMWNEVENPNRILAALASIGKVEDPRIIDPLLKHLFAAPRGNPKEAQSILLAVVPFSLLTEELVNWIVKASTYEHRYHQGWRHDVGFITLEVSNEAVPHLCRVNSPVTSNVLHLIAQKKDITVTMSSDCTPDRQQTVSFQGQRDFALAELRRRGNPPYQREAYLVARDAKIEQLKKQAETERQRERAERYRLLLSLVRNPRTQLGEDKWTYYTELARDFKTVEVFRLLANDLARYHYIQSYDLSRFESLLVEVGQKLSDREVRNALALVQAAWPQTAAGVIERIKTKRSQKS